MTAPAKSLLVGAEVIAFDPADIDTSGRIGFYHPDKAVAVGRLLYKDGQRDLIKVAASKKPGFKWRLLVGLHRTEGARLEGLPVYGVVVSDKPEILRELEASENIHRRPLGPIEKAKFIAALAVAAQERIAREHGNLSQQQRAVRARWDRVKHSEEQAEGALRDETADTCSNMERVYGWEESVRDAFDLGRSAIYRALAIHRLIVEPFPDLIEALAKHPVVGENAKQLLDLTRLKSEAVRRRVIEALLADPEIGVADAMIVAGIDDFAAKVTPVAYEKHYNAIEGAWRHLGSTERTQFLPKFAALLTDGQKRALRDRLNEELGHA